MQYHHHMSNYYKDITILTTDINRLFMESKWQPVLDKTQTLLKLASSRTNPGFVLDNAMFIQGTSYLGIDKIEEALAIYQKITDPMCQHRIGKECADRGLFRDWMYYKPLIALRIMSGSDLPNSTWSKRPKDTKWEPLYRIREMLDEEELFDKPSNETITELNLLLTRIEEAQATTKSDYHVNVISESFFYQTPMFYNLSYCNVNCKNIMQRISRILKPKLSINYKAPRFGKNRRLKVGFFSPCLTKLHSVFRDRSGIITRLPSKYFEKHIIVDKMKFPHATELHKPMYDSADYIWEFYQFSPLDKFVDFMSRLNLDILVYCDIGMSPESVYFSHFRVAPIQINTWGHSLTSGISTIDYYICSKWFELPYDESSKNYSEKLILTDSLSTYYPNLKTTTIMFKERLGLPLDSRPLISCLQMTQKIHLEFYHMMFQIWKRSSDDSKPRFMLLAMKKKSKHDKRIEILTRTFGEEFVSDIIYRHYMPPCVYFNTLAMQI